MFAQMQRTFLVIHESLNGDELRELFVKCFDECPKQRSFTTGLLLRALSRTVLQPPPDLDMAVVSKLAAMFANEHLAVADLCPCLLLFCVKCMVLRAFFIFFACR